MTQDATPIAAAAQPRTAAERVKTAPTAVTRSEGHTLTLLAVVLAGAAMAAGLTGLGQPAYLAAAVLLLLALLLFRG